MCVVCILADAIVWFNVARNGGQCTYSDEQED